MYFSSHIFFLLLCFTLQCAVDASDSLTATDHVCELMRVLYECVNVRMCSVRAFTHELSRGGAARTDTWCVLLFHFFTKWGGFAVNIYSSSDDLHLLFYVIFESLYEPLH